MAISQQTQDFIFSVIDANQEFASKMILIFTMFFISAFVFWFSYYIEKKSIEWNENAESFKLSKVILKRLARWTTGAYLFIFPLMFFFAFRGAKLESLLQIVFSIYIPLMTGLIIFGIMYSWDTVLFFTKLDKTRNYKRRFKR